MNQDFTDFHTSVGAHDDQPVPNVQNTFHYRIE